MVGSSDSDVNEAADLGLVRGSSTPVHIFFLDHECSAVRPIFLIQHKTFAYTTIIYSKRWFYRNANLSSLFYTITAKAF